MCPSSCLSRLSQPTHSRHRQGRRQAGRSELGRLPRSGSLPSGFSSCEASAHSCPEHAPCRQLTPLGLTLQSAFLQSFFRQLVCWSLNSSFTNCPAGKSCRQTRGRPAAQLSWQGCFGFDLSLLPSGQQHSLGQGWWAAGLAASLWRAGRLSGAQASLHPLFGAGGRSSLLIPVSALPSLGWCSPCPWHCPRWSLGRSTAQADACGTPQGPPAGRDAGPP